MGDTIEQIVVDAQKIVGEVSGAGTQTYSEDRMMADCIRAFDYLHKKYPWDQYMTWFRGELDEANGLCDWSLINVRDFEDIAGVYADGTDRKIPLLPTNVNPYGITSGTSSRFFSSLAATDANFSTKRIKVWPVTSTGFLNIQARIYPLEYGMAWDWSDRLELDRHMLIHGTAMMTLLSDDMNPQAGAAQQALMEMRFKDITSLLAKNHPIQVRGSGAVPTEWGYAR